MSQYLPPGERQRQLPNIVFTPSSLLTQNLPRDTVLKKLLIRLHGAITTTFASGTPVADAQSTFDNLISRIDIKIGGGRTVKSVMPHMMHMSQLFNSTVQAERAASAGATAVADDYPVADSGFTYGSTTQITTVRESIVINFENIWANPGDLGRESTWLNLKGVSNAQAILTTGAYSALLGFANTAPVVFSASTLSIDFYTTEAQDVPVNIKFADFKEVVFQYTHSAQVTNQMQLLNTGNMVQGLMFYTRDGAAGSTTTASGKLANSLVLTNLALKLNGQLSVKETDFKALQFENRALFGIQAPYASSVSRIDGVAYLDLLARKDLRTALDCRPPKVDALNLYYNTNASANVSYTNPVTINVMQQEIVLPA